MRPDLLCLLAALTLSPCVAQQPLPATQDTSQIISQAEAQAAAEHKNILVLFTASWCGPCHMLSGFFVDKKVAPIIDQNFVTVRLDVGERKSDPHHANTPGAEKFMATLGGETAGYPYFAMLDPTGKPIVNSLRDGDKEGNIGYPQTAAQIDWFLHMIQTTLPNLDKKQFKTVKEGILDQSNRPFRGKSVEYR
jgi:uncharacterized protein YyaL (SSP411 family)